MFIKKKVSPVVSSLAASQLVIFLISLEHQIIDMASVRPS